MKQAKKRSPVPKALPEKERTLVSFDWAMKYILRDKANFDVSINANNMLNKSYISHLSRLKTDGIPNIGRNIVLGVSFLL